MSLFLRLIVASSLLLFSCGEGVTVHPSTYCLRFDTNVNNVRQSIVINVTRSWAPLGADHLFEVINSSFYSVPSAFFRVVPRFVLQFGISGDPRENLRWNQPIDDGWRPRLSVVLSHHSLRHSRSSSSFQPTRNGLLRYRWSEYSHDSVVHQLC